MWTISPTYAVITAYLSWAGLCLARIWSSDTPGKGRGRFWLGLRLVVRRIFHTLYAFLGIYLLDGIVRICTLDLISYGRFSRVAAPVISGVGLGVLYILRFALVSPSWATLSAFMGMAGTYAFISTSSASPRLDVALFLGWALMLLASLGEVLSSQREGEGDLGGERKGAGSSRVWAFRPFWDLSSSVRILTAPRTRVAVLALLSVELVLQFEGLSLLCWL